MKRTSLIAMLGVVLCGSAEAGARSSADYTIAAEAIGAGGGAVASASYSANTAVGGVVGASTSAVPAETVKHGFVGQLYDPARVVLDASPLTVDEGGTRRIAATAGIDDGTWLALAPSVVGWTVAAGALAGVSLGGVATAATVYADAEGFVGGTFGAFYDTLRLTVLNTDPDNYGTYAADGLPDDWQVGYFGVGNTNAAPGRDPDGDGQTTFFEYVAGLNPTSGVSRFSLDIQPAGGQPHSKRLVFSPRWTDRTYEVLAQTNLPGNDWAAVAGTIGDAGEVRTVTDTNAVESVKFYRVRIGLP